MDLAVHDEREQQRYQNVMKNIDSIKSEGTNMSTSNDTNNGQSVWGPAAGAFFGAAFGEGGFLNGGGGNKTPGVTPDQLGVALSNLSGQFQRDQLQEQIGNSTAALGLGLASVKDAVTGAASQNALSLCGLGNAIAQGFAATNFNIQSEGAANRQLVLEQSNLALRDQLVEARVRLTEAHNAAGHASTQVLVNQVLAKA